ncbi:BTAD domain-containing putative transcriptional regulator [Streptomyces sp. ME02-7008A-1]|uniref:AfsR/SARP family transcriptional regulator n=1 Tax=unclassified Streptomyces TaxID=2593676 RepID=UPI0029BF9F26|nr:MULTISPECIES: BTAD domain-containing putative transcriptional regulator [unclassified Streptomyces]MDX3186219.1 BTAD domain-containing putative transcriptional regulator [Streptomyces sp. ME02-7008A-1]MDX3307332.1 BTAD domain-containing putative transcriptional regulator [Streptomyces sp. ME02-7008A]
MSRDDASLRLLRPFESITGGCRVALPLGGQRLLAYLALQDDGAHRAAAAEQLWPDCAPSRAAANLRSALCQARRLGRVTAIEAAGQRLQLSSTIQVDLFRVREAAQQVIEGEKKLPGDWGRLITDLSRELLPGWSEDWLMVERDRWDQTRVYALESMAQQLQASEQYLPALQAALAATVVDPIRETAHRLAIKVYLAEGNVASAIRCYQNYRAFLRRELGVAPSQQMIHLVQDLAAHGP